MPEPRVRVLLIEQDPEDLRRVRGALAEVPGLTLELCTCSDAAAAVQELQRSEPELVLLGLRPEVSSEEAVAELRSLDAVFQGPVVVLEAGCEEALAQRLIQEGAADCVSKRWLVDGMQGLLPRIARYALERHQLLRDLDRARRLGLHLAHHDTLTDLPNRQLFRSRLRQLIAQARRNPRALAVLFLDLDRFKQINDTLGHGVGDRILQQVARRLEGCIRESDTAARRGGDEFTVILDGVRRGQDAGRVARKILLRLAKPFEVDGYELFLTGSIGISLFPADGGDVDELVKHADIAMYRAKSRGGNGYQFYLPEMNDRALERMEMENSLHVALEREQFFLVYQPQVQLSTGRITGMEALVRWRHPDLGVIYPDEFIPLAEETGLIVQLGEWVLRESCRQNKAWQVQGLPPIQVGVNFSARQFQFKRPVELIEDALKQSGLEPQYLDLELTESAVMQDHSFAMDTLRQLRELGISISIDDFGTGHSSLAHLKRFPITRLKIDKAFVRTLLIDPRDAAITQAIIGMARTLGLKAVAEGVETEAQCEFLRAPGESPPCDQAQGYFFSRPLPAEQAEELLAKDQPMAVAAT